MVIEHFQLIFQKEGLFAMRKNADHKINTPFEQRIFNETAESSRYQEEYYPHMPIFFS